MGCLHESCGKAHEGDTFWCWDCGIQLVPLDGVLAVLRDASPFVGANTNFNRAADYVERVFKDDMDEG